MLVRFYERVFLNEGRWYVWDTAIGMFRPIDSFDWDGYQMVVNDKAYTTDPMDDTYGFGSVEMYKTCMDLTNTYEEKIPGIPTASFINAGALTWFRDRPVSFTECAPRDVPSWKRLVNGRARTCRVHVKNKFTKRNLK
jgi:hypothetical protein